MGILKVKGQVNHITQPHRYNKKGDTKMTVITTIPSFTSDSRLEYIPFDFMGMSMSMLSNVHVGDIVEIDFELRGRKWVNPEGEVSCHYNNEAIDITIIEND